MSEPENKNAEEDRTVKPPPKQKPTEDRVERTDPARPRKANGPVHYAKFDT